MIGAPRPEVVDDDVVAIHFEADARLADVRTADAENTSCKTVGSEQSLARACSPLRLLSRPCVPTCSNTGDCTGPASITRPETVTPRTSATRIGTAPSFAVSRDAYAQHDRVWSCDRDRSVDVVDDWGVKITCLRVSERRIDRRHRVGWSCQKEIRQRNRTTRRSQPVPPRRSGRVGSERRDEDVVAACGVDVEVRIFTTHRRRRERRERRFRKESAGAPCTPANT